MNVRAGAPAPGAARGALPRATSWLLMALTALAAFVGTGLETGSRGAGGVATSATGGTWVPEAGSGPAPDLPPTGARAPAPQGSPAHGDAALASYAVRLLDGGSGRAPPGATGT